MPLGSTLGTVPVPCRKRKPMYNPGHRNTSPMLMAMQIRELRENCLVLQERYAQLALETQYDKERVAHLEKENTELKDAVANVEQLNADAQRLHKHIGVRPKESSHRSRVWVCVWGGGGAWRAPLARCARALRSARAVQRFGRLAARETHTS